MKFWLHLYLNRIELALLHPLAILAGLFRMFGFESGADKICDFALGRADNQMRWLDAEVKKLTGG